MGIQNNSFTRFFPAAGFVAGTVTVTGGTPALGSLCGNALDDAQVSITDNGVGDFTITIQNFKGPQGFVIGFGAAKTLGCIVNPQTGTYSGNAASIEFLISDAAAAAADSTFNFKIWAY